MSDLSISNSALILLGVDPIVSMVQNTKAARLCTEQLPKVRRKLIASHPWNFAMKRASLTPNAVVPAYDYSYSYDLPADYLRFWTMKDSYCDGEDFQIEGGYILANESPLVFKYIADVSDYTKMTALFEELLALELAKNLTFSLNQSSTLKAALDRDYAVALRDARSFDAQENPSDKLSQDTFLYSRY